MSKNKILVKKFGGTSVGSTERIQNIAQRLCRTKKDTEKIVVVVSAMGNTTNELIKLSKEISSNPNPREYDALVSTGENISAALLSMCLNEMGQQAISLTGAQAGIFTEELHSKAKILTVKTERIEKELEKGNIVIITGFQGINPNSDISTIGRGGSDTSAVVLAAALGCKSCDIYTDVDGVYTTDPRKVNSAQKLKEVSYEEMLEMASLGAKVLHPRAVECAKHNQIELHVRSSFNTIEGTYVKEAKKLEVNKPVTGIAIKDKEAIISLIGVPDKPGVAGDIFSELANNNVNVDMIVQSAEENAINNISFSVMEEDLQVATDIVKRQKENIHIKDIKIDNSIAKVSCIGVGMITKPGIAAKMFSALGKAKINIKRITTSEIKISCAIDREHSQKAMEVLHQEFDLAK